MAQAGSSRRPAVKAMPADWQSVIGLEIHVQLATKSKLFSNAPNVPGAEPNRQACTIDLGLPGTLPVLNQKAVDMAVLFGHAIGAQIAEVSFFARKNYFYPDLPKGYQISQYDKPIVLGGSISIRTDEGADRTIRIDRAHLEEDAGKSVHDLYPLSSAIDLNRAGTPLIEIVSHPDLRNTGEAIAYMKKIHTLVRYLRISTANMEKGQFRCDANVSVRAPGQTELGTRCEIKNLNSFRYTAHAIRYEIHRQLNELKAGNQVRQETRLYDPQRDETRVMRTKEEAEDYRYFPDPDLPPIVLDKKDIDSIGALLPELPDAKRARYEADYGLGGSECEYLASDRDVADYFEQCLEASGKKTKLCASWIMTELAAALNKANLAIEACPVPPATLGTLVKRISDGTISRTAAKEVFASLWSRGGKVDAIIQGMGRQQVSDTEQILAWVDQVLQQHLKQVQQYKDGKTKVEGFLVGRIMQASGGKANPVLASRLLKERLKGGRG